MIFIKRITKTFAYFYYPVINIQSQLNTGVDFHPIYKLKASKLKVDRINFKQLTDKTIIADLKKQIQIDKRTFKKQKQIIFIGRSNVGKSSLINRIANQKYIARVAKKPGTTKTMHYHGLKSGGILIDVPGYGMAKINRMRRQKWLATVYDYMKISSRLCRIYLLINTQHGMKKNDLQILKRVDMMNVNIQIVLTKSDKIQRQKLYSQMLSVGQQLKKFQFKNLSPYIHATSSKSQFGIQHLKYSIIQSLQKYQPRNIDDKQDLLLQYLRSNLNQLDYKVKKQSLEQPKKKFLTRKYQLKRLFYNSKFSKFI